MALGQYPEVTLAEARVKRDEARKQKNCGVDPMAARKTAKLVRLVAAENSFATVGRALFVQWKGDRNARHADYPLRRLETNVFPEIGSRPVSEIQTLELVALVKKIASRGRWTSPNAHSRQAVKSFGTPSPAVWLVETLQQTSSPATFWRPGKGQTSRGSMLRSCPIFFGTLRLTTALPLLD